MNRIFALLVSFCLLAAGCGNSSNEFVRTGTGGGDIIAPSNPRAVTFNFVRAQEALEVPPSTFAIRFRFFNGELATGTMVQEETRDYADSITIDPVVGAARSVLITALDSDGFPVLEAEVNVTPGSTVDFADAAVQVVTLHDIEVNPHPVSLDESATQQFEALLHFTNGDTFTANNVTWTADGRISVNSSGLGTAAATSGAGLVTATRGDISGSSHVTVLQGPVVTPRPTVTLGDTSTLGLLTNESPLFAPSVTVTGVGLDGGTLSVRIVSTDNLDATITLPGVPAVGAVNGNNTDEVTVSLNGAATPALLEQLLEAATLNGNTLAGEGLVEIHLVDGVGAAAVTATRPFSIHAPVPTLNLVDVTPLLFGINDSAPLLAPNAVFTDDAANLDGGTLTFEVTGQGNVEVKFPATPNIGTVSPGNPVTVSLNTNSTSANIQAFVRGVTLEGVHKGPGAVEVTVVDAQGASSSDHRNFEFQALLLTVADAGADFTTIQAAIDAVAGTPNASGSVITVADSTLYTAGPESIRAASSSNLEGLVIRGSAHGQSAGISPGVRTSVTRIVQLQVFDVDHVTLDGFDVTAGITAIDLATVSSNVSILNCAFLSGQPESGLNIHTPDARIMNCSIDDKDLGIALTDKASSTSIAGNRFSNCEVVIVQAVGGPTTISGNGFLECRIALRRSGSGSITFSQNDLDRANAFGVNAVQNRASGDLDARNNWWGAPTGPDPANIEGSVTIDPVLTTDPFPSFP